MNKTGTQDALDRSTHGLVDSVFNRRELESEPQAISSDPSKRILSVIKARWVCLGLMLLYGIYLKILLATQSEVTLSTPQTLLPLGALLFVVVYNGWYHISYRWWRMPHLTNLLQLLFDLVVITVLVHFSGGVLSWFWAMYLLLTLEATFLFSWRGVAVIGLIASLLYGGLLGLECSGVIESVVMPFEDGAPQRSLTYVLITWGWVSVMNGAMALVGLYLVGIIHDRESALSESLNELQEKKAIIDRDLQRARQIQGSLLPLDDLPQETGMRIGARMIPAAVIGGDYYDYLVKDDNVYVSIGDVSGKGVEAGLIMAIARTLLRSLVRKETDPSLVLAELGTYLRRDMPRNQFMSFLLLRWDGEENRLHCAGAGHEKIILYRADTGRCEVMPTGGTALGVWEDAGEHLCTTMLSLEPGDLVVLYTDGVTEARNGKGDFFGLDRFVALVEDLGANFEGPPKIMVDGIIDRIDDYREGCALHDDITVLVLGRDTP